MDTVTINDYLQQADPILAALIEPLEIARFEPFPIVRRPVGDRPSSDSLLSALTKAIFYQSISIQSANAVYKRFCQLYPDSTFPSATAILATDDAALRAIGLSHNKIRYLKNLAEQTLQGLPTLAELESLSDDRILQVLTQLHGIGRWSAQMVLIFQLRRLDVLPTGDLGLRAAIRDLYGFSELPAPKIVEKLAAPWAPYRTVATWYLWQTRGEAARALLQAWS